MLKRLFSRVTMVAAVATSLVLFSPTAKAAVFDFSLSGIGISATGQFFTGSPSSPYLLTNITGIINGFTITGLDAVYGSPDNTLTFPGSPDLVSFAGISFDTNDLNKWNLGRTNLNDYGITDLLSNPAGTCCGTHPIEFSVTAAVPEPATWMLMLLGFAAMGFGAYRRSQKVALAAT